MQNFLRINASDWMDTLPCYYDFNTFYVVKRDNILFIEQTLTIKENGHACLEMFLPVYDKDSDCFLLTKHVVNS